MNFDAIRHTMILSQDTDTGLYRAESPLYDRCHGFAETKAQAKKAFLENLLIIEADYHAGRLATYAQPGRPKKHKQAIHAEVTPAVRQIIKNAAQHLGISQGELIEVAVHMAVAEGKISA